MADLASNPVHNAEWVRKQPAWVEEWKPAHYRIRTDESVSYNRLDGVDCDHEHAALFHIPFVDYNGRVVENEQPERALLRETLEMADVGAKCNGDCGEWCPWDGTEDCTARAQSIRDKVAAVLREAGE